MFRVLALLVSLLFNTYLLILKIIIMKEQK
jgi:hypothetical protein